MKTPNITPAQILGLVTALGGQAVAFGLLDGQQEQLVVSAVTAAVGIAVKLADAIIRHGRSRALNGQIAAAITHEATAPAAPTNAVPLTTTT